MEPKSSYLLTCKWRQPVHKPSGSNSLPNQCHTKFCPGTCMARSYCLAIGGASWKSGPGEDGIVFFLAIVFTMFTPTRLDGSCHCCPS